VQRAVDPEPEFLLRSSQRTGQTRWVGPKLLSEADEQRRVVSAAPTDPLAARLGHEVGF